MSWGRNEAHREGRPAQDPALPGDTGPRGAHPRERPSTRLLGATPKFFPLAPAPLPLLELIKTLSRLRFASLRAKPTYVTAREDGALLLRTPPQPGTPDTPFSHHRQTRLRTG